MQKIDIPENPPLGIENSFKSLSYIPDQGAEDLVNNLITFLNTCDQNQIPVELNNSTARRLPKHSCSSTRNLMMDQL